MGLRNFTFNLAKMANVIILSSLLSSCTEEVAEELKNNASSDTLSNTTGDLTKSSMRLVNKMDDTFSFRLHAEGVQNAPCQISPSNDDGFDPSTYYKDPNAGPAPQVVDCILEAQENDLYQQGAKIELQVDGQLCEYVSYEPFKFVEMPYGSTTKTVYKVECAAPEETCGTGGRCDNYYDTYDSSAADLTDNAFTNSLSEEQALNCKFDYSTGEYGENCDEGDVRVVTYEIDNSTYDHDTDADTEEICRPIASMSYNYAGAEEAPCGGEHEACMGGPAVEYFGDQTTSSMIFTNTELSEFNEEFEIQAPIERQDNGPYSLQNNMYIANYSRLCANNDSAKNYASGFTGYDFEGFESETLRESFRTMYVDENGVELFLYYDSLNSLSYYDNVNQDGADACDFDTSDVTYPDCAEFNHRSYAENPWRALHRTSPYYSFKCRDQAYDVKAQIRLFIRDWDRDFAFNQTAFSVVSDVGAVNSLMDNYGNQDGDDWNDRIDWDDWFGDGYTWENNQCTTTNSNYHHSSNLFPGNL